MITNADRQRVATTAPRRHRHVVTRRDHEHRHSTASSPAGTRAAEQPVRLHGRPRPSALGPRPCSCPRTDPARARGRCWPGSAGRPRHRAVRRPCASMPRRPHTRRGLRHREHRYATRPAPLTQADRPSSPGRHRRATSSTVRRTERRSNCASTSPNESRAWATRGRDRPRLQQPAQSSSNYASLGRSRRLPRDEPAWRSPTSSRSCGGRTCRPTDQQLLPSPPRGRRSARSST